MARLQGEEREIVTALSRKVTSKRKKHRQYEMTYMGLQAVDILGIAIPPEMRGFEFPLNWCRVAVDEIEHRMDVKTLSMPGQQSDDHALREGWDANDMDLQSSLNHREVLVHGHGFVTVGTNPDDAAHPRIAVESARTMVAKIDGARRTMDAALRLYSDPSKSWAPDSGTLYLPNSTVWITREGHGAWEIVDRDDHNLGRVPVVMFLNRQRAADWQGESEMSDLIPLVGMAARTIANHQAAQETIGAAKRWITGATKGDFVGADGKPRAEWEAYYDAIWAFSNPDAKVGQLPGADVSGFVDTITMLAEQASALTGLPMRYFGKNPANPASEGAISADESRLVKNVERKNREAGTAWGWVMGLYERFRTGEWVEGGRIGVEPHDPGTPTLAQKTDALQKLHGSGIISREGVWDELGWSPERKERERAYLAAEASDPVMMDIADRLSGGVA